MIHRLKTKYQKGFSIIELIVVVAIMLVVTSVTLLRQSKFSSDILITNMAYAIGLDIREAGVLGTSSRQSDYVTTVGSGNSDEDQYRVGYGVHFSMNADGNDTNTYVKFVDLPDPSTVAAGVNADFNYYYDNGSDPVNGGLVTMSQGRILRFCGQGDAGWDCVSDASNDPNTLDIVFVKPNPDAHITMGGSGGRNGRTYSSAIVVVQSALGDKCRTIRVYASGQVAIDTIDPEATNGGCDVVQ